MIVQESGAYQFHTEVQSESSTSSSQHLLSTSSGVSHSGTTPTSTTTSCTRAFSDLDTNVFLTSAFTLCGLRTALQQPINIALLRKQSVAIFQQQSTRSVLSHIYRDEGGWRGLSRGMPAMTLGCALSEVVYLFLLEYGREILPLGSEGAKYAFSAYGADITCRLIHIPLSIIAYRQMSEGLILQSNSPQCLTSLGSTATKKPTGAYRTLCHMYQERGLRTVYAGLGTTVLIGSQWSAVWWVLYAKSKGFLYRYATPYLESLPSNQIKSGTTVSDAASWDGWSYLPSACTHPTDNALISTIASSFTSASTAVLFNPFLVLRTNLQIQPHASLWSTTKSIYHQRGWRGFYNGLYLSMVACVIDGALSSLTYEYARLWADNTKK